MACKNKLTLKKDAMPKPFRWTPEELQALIDGYFASTPESQYTITGLCLHLDTNKQTLLNYQNRDAYSEMVQRAKLRVEHSYEKYLRLKDKVTGEIFALKNFGWSDRREIEHSGEVGITINIVDDDEPTD